MKKIELLAPVGSMKKLSTALHFGADAVYLAGKDFGLRAFADNFSYEEIAIAVSLCHKQNKKAYVTINIFAQNSDFGQLKEYLKILEQAKVDAVIVSDVGVVAFIKKHSKLDIHLSTQANTTNKYAVDFWRDMGLSRVVLARELSLESIREIADFVDGAIELEAFVHGAMCISYSGRCLLSSYLANRDSNRGECVQSCRWEYNITEKSRPNKPLTLLEDARGSYILNSKDLCTLPILDQIIDAGIVSLKIEGRMKSEYYVATVINAYRKRIDDISKGNSYNSMLLDELHKVSHREYTDGFYLNKEAEVCYNTSMPNNDFEFIAEVKGYDEDKGAIIVEQRNRFFQGDTLEILSTSSHHNEQLIVDDIKDMKGKSIEDCKIVQQLLHIKSNKKLLANDILRKRVKR